MRIRTILFILVAIAAAYFIIDSVTQPNTKTLAGNFKETAMYRNPNNTGPVVRIYAVTVEDTLWHEMELYGQMMPYTKYGTTTVYFFKSGGPSPDRLDTGLPHFGSEYQKNCLGKFHKDAMAAETFSKFPFEP